jgi:hypothetical protein
VRRSRLCLPTDAALIRAPTRAPPNAPVRLVATVLRRAAERAWGRGGHSIKLRRPIPQAQTQSSVQRAAIPTPTPLIPRQRKAPKANRTRALPTPTRHRLRQTPTPRCQPRRLSRRRRLSFRRPQPWHQRRMLHQRCPSRPRPPCGRQTHLRLTHASLLSMKAGRKSQSRGGSA